MRIRTVMMVVAAALGLATLVGARAGAAQVADTRPGIAVLPFTSGGSIGPDRVDIDAWEVGLQQMLLTELAQNPALRIVERSRIRELLEELDLARTDRVDPQTAARIGRLVGARYVITGVFMDVSGTLRMDARIIDGETSEVLRARDVRGPRDTVYDLLVELSAQVTEGMQLPRLAAELDATRRARGIPSEAAFEFMKAVALEDDGDIDGAIELYRMISQRFPQMTEATEALRQLTEAPAEA